MNSLETSAYHKKFMNNIERFENRGYSHKKAIKAALKKNRHVFDQILNQFEPDSDEDKDDNSDEDDNSVEETEDANDEGDDDDTEDEEPPMKKNKAIKTFDVFLDVYVASIKYKQLLLCFILCLNKPAYIIQRNYHILQSMSHITHRLLINCTSLHIAHSTK